MNREKWLNESVLMALTNVQNGGDPFVAIIVKNDKFIGSGTNLVHLQHNLSAHAELLVIREAYTTLKS